MYVFLPLLHNGVVVGRQHVHFVALQLQKLLEHAKMYRQHLGHQERILLFHLLGKQEPSVFIVNQFSHTLCGPFPLSRNSKFPGFLFRHRCSRFLGLPSRFGLRLPGRFFRAQPGIPGIQRSQQ